MVRLTLRQLEILEAVARHGSFSRASKDVHLTQPAVSMQIKQLEETLGLPLFEHVGKKIQLTEAGRETLTTSQTIGRELDNLEHTLADLRGLKGGTLKVSVASTASYFAARLMALFRQVHPEVRISLNVVNRAMLLQHLTDNSVDLALMGRPPEGLGLTAEPFMDNPLVVIASPTHPFAKIRNIPLARLAEEPLVGREPGSGTRGAVENVFAEHGLELKVAMEMNKNEAIKQAVEAGLGLGVVSLHIVQSELASGELCVLDVQGFPLMRQWYLVRREGKRPSPAARAFSEFVLSEARQAAQLGTEAS
ncbi:MAG: LysR family transcriptional regulator [Guyparkeria sp.]|uniref:LysR family transcriptional regulator n=1 Tax=Guyparkeria sp. TaxID=2035736 RepID=UPI00397AD5A1